MDEFSVIRDSIDGKNKYARLPIRRKSPLNDLGNGDEDTVYLSAEIILNMPLDELCDCCTEEGCDNCDAGEKWELRRKQHD